MTTSHLYYPNQGLAEITFKDDKMTHLFIKRTRIKIVVPTEKTLKMRGLSTKEIILKSLQALEETVPASLKNWNQKKRQYEDSINSGDLIRVAQSAAEIKANPKTLSLSEKQILQSCLSLIEDEARIVLGTCPKLS